MELFPVYISLQQHILNKLCIFPKAVKFIKTLQRNRTQFNTYVQHKDFHTEVQLAMKKVLAPILSSAHMYLS